MLSCLLCAAASFLAAVRDCEASDGSPPVLTLSDIQARLLNAQARLRSLYVKYRIPYDQEGVPANAYAQRITALKGPCSFFLDNSHGHEDGDWTDDSNRSRTFVTQKGLTMELPYNRCYETLSLATNEALPLKLQSDFYLVALAWWPPDYLRPPPRRPAGKAFTLKEVAQSKDYRLLDKQENRDGIWCHILEIPHFDKLWLDASRGCALLHRECFDPENRALEQQLHLRDYREIAPGVWLPFAVQVLQYDSAARSPQERQRVVLKADAQVLDIHANDLDDSLFTFELPPGSVLFSRRSGEWKQTHPGGLDFLSIQANRMKGYKPAENLWLVLSWFAGAPLLFLIIPLLRIATRKQCERRTDRNIDPQLTTP
jgi:hypothetical protein